MTCREKLRLDHPSSVNSNFTSGCAGCPDQWGYLDPPTYCEGSCDEQRCSRCWDREIPEDNKEETTKTYFLSWFDTTTMTIGNCSVDVDAKISGSELITKIVELAEKTVSKNAVVLTFQSV